MASKRDTGKNIITGNKETGDLFIVSVNFTGDKTGG
jgi:hypothetical protein